MPQRDAISSPTINEDIIIRQSSPEEQAINLHSHNNRHQDIRVRDFDEPSHNNDLSEHSTIVEHDITPFEDGDELDDEDIGMDGENDDDNVNEGSVDSGRSRILQWLQNVSEHGGTYK